MIRRLVVVQDAPRSKPPYRLVRIREREGVTGSYQAAILETVKTRSNIEGGWIWWPH